MIHNFNHTNMAQLEKDFQMKLRSSMENMNGTEFEYMCKNVFDSIIGEESIHKGHTMQGKPAGYTADFYDNQVAIIGQCGTDEDYFAGFEKNNKGVYKKKIENEKPVKDFLKVTNRYPSSKKVYIFSNRYATGNKFSEVTKAVNELIIKTNINQKFILFDAQRISKLIYKRCMIENRITNIIEQYFPEAFELYKLFPNTNSLPFSRSKEYYSRQEEKEVVDLINAYDFLQIHGLSGIGKSELCIQIAHKLMPSYELALWIDAEEINTSDFSFQSIKILKFDTPINLSYFLATYKCLLIIDNLNTNTQSVLREFTTLNKMRSKCIITSLQKSVKDNHAYNLSFVDKKISTKILNDIKPRPTSAQLRQIIDTVGGYPLLLTIIVANIENNNLTWEEITEDLGHVKDLQDDSRGTTIAKRILGKIKELCIKEFSFIAYLASNKISQEFTVQALGKLPVSKLKTSSIIKINDINHFSIHQVVLDSIKEEITANTYEIQFDNLLKKYISQNNEIKSFGYYDFIFTHSDFLNTKIKTTLDLELRKVIIYSKTQALDFKIYSSEIIELINSVDTSGIDYYSLSLLIEKYEITRSPLLKEEYLSETDSQLLHLLEIENKVSEPITKTMLCHHIGKIYLGRFSKLCKRTDAENAKTWFEKVLSDDKVADYALLQLTRLSIKKGETSAAESYIRTAFEIKEMSLTVLISFYEIIFQSTFENLRKEFIDNYIVSFRDSILKAINSSFDQPYILLGKISDSLNYLFKDVFSILAEALPCPVNINSSPQLKFSYAKIQSVFYNYLINNTSTNVEKLNSIKTVCIEYFEQVSLNQFQLKEYCKFLLLSKEYTLALSKCDALEDKDPFIYQIKAKIYFSNGLLDLSLANINQAISIGESRTISNGFKAAFYNDKAEAMNALAPGSGIDTLRTAIGLQTDVKSKFLWESKLADWKNSLYSSAIIPL